MRPEARPAPPFRRRPFEAPHRRRGLAARLVRPFVVAALLVGAPAAVAAWLLRGPQLSLRRIEVAGCERVEPRWVRDTLAPLVGRRLLFLDFREVEARLLEHPWIRGVTVRKELPDRLAVAVDERRPAARLARGDEVLLVDDEGVVIASFDGDRHPPDLPLLRGVEIPAREIPEALSLAARWRELSGEAAPAEIERVGEADFRVLSPDLPFPVLVEARSLATALGRLERLLPGLSARYPAIEQLDLRFERQIVVHTAAEPQIQEG